MFSNRNKISLVNKKIMFINCIEVKLNTISINCKNLKISFDVERDFNKTSE